MLVNVEPVDVTVAQGLAQKKTAALYTCGEVGLRPLHHDCYALFCMGESSVR